jgi:hypothetical protein
MCDLPNKLVVCGSTAIGINPEICWWGYSPQLGFVCMAPLLDRILIQRRQFFGGCTNAISDERIIRLVAEMIAYKILVRPSQSPPRVRFAARSVSSAPITTIWPCLRMPSII